MNKIKWMVTEQNLSQQLVSDDNRWHISKTQNGHADSAFFLSNYDLLLTPHGSGSDYRECFEKFIADCDAFIEKTGNIRDEAREHLNALLETEKELSHEN